MEMQTERTINDILLITLTGRLDIKASMAIDLPLTARLRSHHTVIVDVSAVEVIAVLGLRTLLLAIKAAVMAGNRVVLMGPDSNVRDILTAGGATSVIPVAKTFAEAQAMALASVAANKVLVNQQAAN
jgi:anti-anti-sigma factor